MALKLHAESFYGKTLCNRAIHHMSGRSLLTTAFAYLATCGDCRRSLRARACFPSPSMSPVLVLTREERNAIDWVGGRYFHGSELRDWLHSGPDCKGRPVHVLYDAQPTPDDLPWYDEEYRGDIGFRVSGKARTRILRGFESEDFEFACFAGSLARKLHDWASQ